MVQKYFIYDLKLGQWVETKDPKFTGDIDRFPKALVGQDEKAGYINSNMLWAVSDISLFDLRYNIVNINAALRWRIQTSEKLKTVIIIAECCNLVQNQSSIHYRISVFERENVEPMKYLLMKNINQFSLRLDYGNWKYLAVPAVQHEEERNGLVYKYRKDWTLQGLPSYIKVPEIVVDTAMEILKEFARQEYGFVPTVPDGMEGVELLKSYACYPLDPMTAFWSETLDYSYKQKLLRSAPSNFELVCEALDLPQTKGLRKAYHSNGQSLMVIYFLRKYMGIEDVNIWPMFYDMHNLFGVPMYNIGIDVNGEFIFKGQTLYNTRFPDEKEDNTEKLKEYYAWASEKWSSTVAAAHIKKALNKWHYEFDYMLRLLKRMEYDLSDESMKLLYNEGITIEVNNAISREYRIKYENGIYDRLEFSTVIFDIKKAELDRAIKTKNGEFVVARIGEDLLDISKEMDNCVLTYLKDAEYNVCTIYTYRQNEKMEACIEVRDGAVVQALGPSNARLSGIVLDEVKDWALKFKLSFNA